MKQLKAIPSSLYVIIFLMLLVGGFLFFLPFYLGPNDISGCQKMPSASSKNKNCHPADAIVALSGGDTAARTSEAIKLYEAGWASKLIFSGAAQDKTGPSNAQAMKKQALFNGVPADAILIEETAQNTQQNASKTQQLVQDNNLHRVILVTSAYHQRRASLEFKKRTGSDIRIINHPVKYDRQWHKHWYLTPSGWWLAFSEMVKIVDFYASGK